MNKSDGLTGWRLHAARILAFIAVIAITLFVFSIRDKAAEFQAYGYPGIFFISILANATVILPAPGIALTYAFGAVFHPSGVAIAAGTGAALGELTGYLAGFSGQGIVNDIPMYERITGWTDRYGGWVVLVLAFIPNPFFDIAGAAAGALKMRVHVFLMWALIGKILKMLLIAYAGAASLDWVLNLFPSVQP